MTEASKAQVIRVGLVAGQVFRCDNGTKVENRPGVKRLFLYGMRWMR